VTVNHLAAGSNPAAGANTHQRENGAIVYWLGYLTLYQVERDRYPLALPIAHVAKLDQCAGLRIRRVEVRLLSCAPNFYRVKLVQEESRAWNAEAGGQNTAP
jgi:hypothetical protein